MKPVRFRLRTVMILVAMVSLVLGAEASRRDWARRSRLDVLRSRLHEQAAGQAERIAGSPSRPEQERTSARASAAFHRREAEHWRRAACWPFPAPAPSPGPRA